MIRNRNAIQLLCLLCLLVHPAINANLEARTIIGQRNDSVSHPLIRHQLGFDVRPGYIVSTHSFLQGDNAQQRKSTNRFPSISSTLSDSAKNPTSAGSFPIPIRVLAFPTILSLVPLNWEIPCRYTLFKGSRIAQLSPPVCRSITNGTSVLLFGWKKYDELSIRKTC